MQCGVASNRLNGPWVLSDNQVYSDNLVSTDFQRSTDQRSSDLTLPKKEAKHVSCLKTRLPAQKPLPPKRRTRDTIRPSDLILPKPWETHMTLCIAAVCREEIGDEKTPRIVVAAEKTAGEQSPLRNPGSQPLLSNPEHV
jgi:hypothetical protein